MEEMNSWYATSEIVLHIEGVTFTGYKLSEGKNKEIFILFNMYYMNKSDLK